MLDLTPTTGAVLYYIMSLICHKDTPIVQVTPEYKKQISKTLGIKYGTVNSKLRYLVNNFILVKHPNAYGLSNAIHLVGITPNKAERGLPFWKRWLNIK